MGSLERYPILAKNERDETAWTGHVEFFQKYPRSDKKSAYTSIR